MTEKEKMLYSELYNSNDPILFNEYCNLHGLLKNVVE